jgi:ribose transport system ATP-binding protein
VDELRTWKASDVTHQGGVLLLDEATAVLDREGKNRVAELVRRIASDGAGVVVVSHDLKEMVNVANRITMLRDGAVVGSADASSFATPDGIESLIEMMTGHRRDVSTVTSRRRSTPPGQQIVAEVKDLTGDVVRDFGMQFHDGEVVGITGLVGSGWEEVPSLLFGARVAEQGSLHLAGTNLDIAKMTPRRAIKHGIGLVPANRQDDGVVGDLSVRANVSLPIVSSFMQKGRLRAAVERREIHSVLEDYRVVPADPELDIQALSGGNQQKAVMARWLNTHPKLLLLQDPTQGVDVGARERIQDIVWRAARSGTAVLYASADYEELAAVADRVLIISDGALVDEISGANITEDAISAACLRGAAHRSTQEVAAS